MIPERYSLAEVLAVAAIHPFYHSDIEYAPSAEAIQAALARATEDGAKFDILTQPLLQKKSMYVQYPPIIFARLMRSKLQSD